VTEEAKYTEQGFHKKMAVSLFNMVWGLLDKEGRTPDEDAKMVHAAHASRYHWGEVGTPLHFERGEWQISRVYAVLRRPEPALHHAQACLRICEENDYGDFDLAFAYEAMARALATAGSVAQSEKYIELAQQAGELIEEEDSKKMFFDELATVPRWAEE
jgi:hypothetical protein